jgi:hypothetical protein
MTTKQRLFALLAAAFLIINSCSTDSSTLDFLDENQKTSELSEQNLIGAWTFNSYYSGKVFLQFDIDGTLHIYYNYEGEHFETASWQLVGDKIVTSNNSLFLTWALGMQPYFWEEESVNGLKVSDFNSNSFNLLPKDNQVKDDEPVLIVTRLIDEAGEPIIHYSLFNRSPNEDSRYGDSYGGSVYEDNSTPNDYSHYNSESIQACSYCKGTGNCSSCHRVFKKRFFGYKCQVEERDEIKLGYVICETCHGWGFQRTNIGCDCGGGGGWCYESDCYVRDCFDAWIPCSECNYNGRGGEKLGKCSHCKGKGSS